MEAGLFSLHDFLNLLKRNNEDKAQYSLNDSEKSEIFINLWIIMEKVLQALRILIEKKIIHSDIKPENLMIVKKEKEFQLKLIDFDSMLSWQEYEENSKRIFGWTIEYAPQKTEGLNESNFLKFDIFCFKKSFAKVIDVLLGEEFKGFFNQEQEKIMKEFKTSMLLEKTIENTEDLETFSNELANFLKTNKIELKDKRMFVPDKILSKKIFNIINDFQNSDDIRFIEDCFKLNYFEFLEVISKGDKKLGSMINQSTKNHYYAICLLNECLKDEKNPKMRAYFLSSIAKSKVDAKEQEAALKIIEDLEKKYTAPCEIAKFKLTDYYFQHIFTNVIYVYIENRKFAQALKIILVILRDLENNKLFPKESKKIEDPDIDYLNEFYANIFNLYGLVLSYASSEEEINQCFELIPHEAYQFNGLSFDNIQDKKQIFREKSLELTKKSLIITKTLYIEDSAEIAKCFNNLGAKYLQLNIYKDAIDYFDKSYETRNKLHKAGYYKDRSMALIPYLNKAKSLEGMGGAENDKKAYEIACEVKKERVALGLEKSNNHMTQVNEFLEKLEKKGVPQI